MSTSTIIGQVFGKWTVVEESGLDLRRNKLYKCRCSCGTEKRIRKNTLVCGDSSQCKSCAARKIDLISDIVGKKIGKSLVLKEVYRKEREENFYLVRCECNTEKEVPGYLLRKGLNTKCPGCRVKNHGMSYSATYRVWGDMKNRCYNPNLKSYKYYGGRGIIVCDSWLEKFDNFYADMGDKPEKYQLDRIDNNGNYEPSNCRWVTAKVNVNNRRNSKKGI